MDSYRVVVSHSAEKEIMALDKAVIPLIWEKIRGLAEEPRPRQSRKLMGTRDVYRLRIGDYRVVYQIDGEQQVVTVKVVRHRKEVYR